MHEEEFQKYKHVQSIAKKTMDRLSSFIQTGVSEIEIAEECERIMREKGVSSFWYYGVPALVLVGERTTLSVSGKDYKPTDTKVKELDLVTIDLNPEIDEYWGDYARSFALLDGKVINLDDEETDQNMIDRVFKFGDELLLLYGPMVEQKLHEKLLETAHPNMTFEELYFEMNDEIEKGYYENLDFHGNLGHTIEKSLSERKYIEKGNAARLGDSALFTFEPHITAKADLGKLVFLIANPPKTRDFGFKREDVYYFEDGMLKVL